MMLMAIELVSYREWTEMLGEDREWKIQSTQFNIARVLSLYAGRVGGFAFPLRYDYSIVVVSGLRRPEIQGIFDRISEISPVAVRGCVGWAPTPTQAQREISSCLKEVESGELRFMRFGEDGQVHAAHFDVNNFSAKAKETSIYDTYLEISEILLNLSKRLYSLGAMTHYLGGDNVLSFIPKDSLKDVLDMVSSFPFLKVGIGVGRKPRDAVRNAAKALSTVRRERTKAWAISS